MTNSNHPFDRNAVVKAWQDKALEGISNGKPLTPDQIVDIVLDAAWESFSNKIPSFPVRRGHENTASTKTLKKGINEHDL